MTERLNLIVSGDVQAVGYRKEVQKAAIQFNIMGYAKNMNDGNVRVVCEGETENLAQFREAIKIRKDRIYVDDIIQDPEVVIGEFHRFRIYEDNMSVETRQILKRLDKGLEMTDSMHQDLSKGQMETTEAVKAMDAHMSARFDNLDAKYGEFGDTMKGVAVDMKGMAADTNDMKGSMSGMAVDLKAIKDAAVPPRKIRKLALKHGRPSARPA